MPTFNADLAERILAQIRDDPEHWDQRSWAAKTGCGTSFCFAGWACNLELSGLQIYSPYPVSATGFFYADDHPGRRQNFRETACRLLGIDWSGDREFHLFMAGNTYARLEQLVKHYANNPDGDDVPDHPKDTDHAGL